MQPPPRTNVEDKLNLREIPPGGVRPHVREIGFWTDKRFAKGPDGKPNRYALRGSAMLVDEMMRDPRVVALMRSDTDNVVSNDIAEKLGFVHIGIDSQTPVSDATSGEINVWQLDHDAFQLAQDRICEIVTPTRYASERGLSLVGPGLSG